MWDRIIDIMHRSWSGCLVVFLLVLAACGPTESLDQDTPTPFGTELAGYHNPVTEPIPISLTHLAANPEFFEGSTLILSGEYRRLPVLACDRDPHPGPATWGIVSEGLMASAAGYDEQLRKLLNENQQIVVEGRWLRFAGPIGCGKSAPAEELWYLSVDRVIEPHPLARATKASIVQSGEPTTISEVPAETADPLQTAAPTLTEPPVTPTSDPATEVQTPINVTSTAGPIPTPTSNQAPTPTTSAITTTATVTTTTTATATLDAVTGTPGASPTLSATQEGQTVNNKGPLDYEDLQIETLDEGIPDRWTLPIDSAESITITVAPANNANLTITVLDENGTAIVEAHNQAPAGAVETIRALDLANTGIYQVLISSSPSVQADYAIMVMNSESYAFIFQGILVPASPQNKTIEAESDHFWFVSLSDGDTFSLRVIPNSQSDPYLELYDPQGSRLATYDDTGIGETESIEEYEALEDGLYGIRVGEFDFSPMSYQILLSEP